jgi:hypothetical protein
MHLSSTPFSVLTDDVPGNTQMETIDLQCNSGLKEKYNNTWLFYFYPKYIDRHTFPAIHSQTLKMVSVYGSMQKPFSRMKNVKSKSWTRITNTQLENSLRIGAPA